MSKQPSDYAQGWGELIRAHRVYIGISQRTLAGKLQMSERSLSDIEVGRRACPPGFLNAVQEVAQQFYGDVKKVTDAADDDLVASSGGWFELPVSADPKQEWTRAVVARAAVENGNIMPVLIAT
jgi:hypothetical protein